MWEKLSFDLGWISHTCYEIIAVFQNWEFFKFRTLYFYLKRTVRLLKAFHMLPQNTQQHLFDFNVKGAKQQITSSNKKTTTTSTSTKDHEQSAKSSIANNSAMKKTTIQADDKPINNMKMM